MNEITEELQRMWTMLSVMFAFGGIWTPAEAYIGAETLPASLPPDEIAGWEREHPGRLCHWNPGPAD